MGFPGHTVGEYKYFVGDGIPKLIERALPENRRDKETKDACLKLFMADYRVHYHDKTNAYDGVREMLSELKSGGLKLAVISNKAQEMAEKVASTLFGDIFDLVAGKREGYKTKPDPALTLFVMDSLGVSPSECALAGDSGMDMAAAVNAGALPDRRALGLQNGRGAAKKRSGISVFIPRGNNRFDRKIKWIRK